jgi:hypothetical protein
MSHESAGDHSDTVATAMATESACLLIADISGYTGYLAGVEIDHAQDILADLTMTIVSALRPGFRLAKPRATPHSRTPSRTASMDRCCSTRSSAATSAFGAAAATSVRRPRASATPACASPTST